MRDINGDLSLDLVLNDRDLTSFPPVVSSVSRPGVFGNRTSYHLLSNVYRLLIVLQ